MSRLAEVPILGVWQALGGGPVRHARAKAFWRDGDGWNVAIDADRGRWFDFASGVGGGVLALVETAGPYNRPEALRWLETQGFLAPRDLTKAELAHHRERRSRAHDEAVDLGHWMRAIVPELEAAKAAALETGDEHAHSRAARRHYLIACCDAATVLAEFRRHRNTAPAEVERLIEAGRADEREVDLLARLIAEMLGEAEARRADA